jgi:hypothetical protein
MLTEGIDCLCCKQNKMKKTNKPDLYEQTGLDELNVNLKGPSKRNEALC